MRTPARLCDTSGPPRDWPRRFCAELWEYGEIVLWPCRGESIQWEFLQLWVGGQEVWAAFVLFKHGGSAAIESPSFSCGSVQIDGNLFNRKILIWLGDRDDCIAIDRHIGGL